MEKFVITISRGYGCGGHQIAWELSKKLGINFYDREILNMASMDSGIRQDLFYKADEKVKVKARLAAIGLPKFDGKIISPDQSGFLSDKNMFNYQAKVIKELADRESCIIIGRAADYILKDYPNLIRINIQAEPEDRVKNITKYEVIDKDEALRKVLRKDRERAEYYLYYTGRRWNDELNYDLTFNTSKVSNEQCAELILAYAKSKFGDEIVVNGEK